MSYIAFARKYRPQSFDDIIGQSHVTTTLKNAISQDRVAHAYLFAGPRGVGKTTAARILAKALNCEKGPAPTPCNSCAVCKEITQGSSLDTLEIDGASNRGIDEIRNLRENVKFAPAKGKFKVYIIDEVHMLTPEAFNALLKTLEEPPPHVKFIFATTQPHKVPPTILSRCQRFDFRRIAVKDIVANLKKIAKAEKSEIDDEALALIARYSDGGMRDAQVMLDQITSFAKGKVTALEVTKTLGMVEDEVLFELSRSIREKNAPEAIGILDRLIDQGKDVTQITLGLIEHFRNISIAKVGSSAGDLIDASPEIIKHYQEEAAGFTIEDILYVIYTFSNTIDFIRKSHLLRVPLEAALIKLTLSHSIVPLAEIIKRVELLERQGGCPVPAPQISKPVNPQTHQPINPPTRKPVNPQTDELASPGLDEILGCWQTVINAIMQKKMSVASYLQEGYPISLEDNKLSIGFPKELQFHKEVLETPDNKRLIEEAIKSSLAKELKVMFVLIDSAKVSPRQTGHSDTEATNSFTEGGEAVKKEVDPILKAALEIFGGNNVADDASGKRKA